MFASPTCIVMSETTEAVYQFIRQYFKEHGLSPSQRDIAKGCYISQSTVGRHLDILEAHGWIRRANGVFRSISILDRTDSENPIK